jgi:hypothetical protein
MCEGGALLACFPVEIPLLAFYITRPQTLLLMYLGVGNA